MDEDLFCTHIELACNFLLFNILCIPRKYMHAANYVHVQRRENLFFCHLGLTLLNIKAIPVAVITLYQLIYGHLIEFLRSQALLTCSLT